MADIVGNKMMKLCVLEIKVEFCNHKCPHFYHKYDDDENCYCAKLDKKVYDYGYFPDQYEDPFQFDYLERPIPNECPLSDIH